MRTLEEENEKVFKVFIPLPKELETFIAINNINKNDVNFYMVVNHMIDTGLDLIISNGDLDINKRVNNIIEEVKLARIYNSVPMELENEECFNIIRESLYAIMESLLEHTEYHKPSTYNYIVESIFNNKIIIVIMNK